MFVALQQQEVEPAAVESAEVSGLVDTRLDVSTSRLSDSRRHSNARNRGNACTVSASGPWVQAGGTRNTFGT